MRTHMEFYILNNGNILCIFMELLRQNALIFLRLKQTTTAHITF
jgi:hypothetical protein